MTCVSGLPRKFLVFLLSFATITVAVRLPGSATGASGGSRPALGRSGIASPSNPVPLRETIISHDEFLMAATYHLPAPSQFSYQQLFQF